MMGNTNGVQQGASKVSPPACKYLTWYKYFDSMGQTTTLSQEGVSFITLSKVYYYFVSFINNVVNSQLPF